MTKLSKIPQPAEEIELILSSATWDKMLVSCLFCFEDNGEPTRFWVTQNEYRCEKCGKRGWVHDIPFMSLNGSVK